MLQAPARTFHLAHSKPSLSSLLAPPQPLDDEDEMMTGFAGFMGSGLSGRCEGCGIVLGEGLEVALVPPWTAVHAEAVNPDSSFSEAALRRATTLLQRKCSQGLCERHCPDCAEAHGHKRKCRRLSPEDVGRGVLSMDLSGPHPAAFSGHRYILVANLSMPEGDDIPFSRLLKTKTTEEVARALTSVMCQIVSLAQGAPPVFRIHSDAGKEFIGGACGTLSPVVCGLQRVRHTERKSRKVGWFDQGRSRSFATSCSVTFATLE